MEVVMSTQQTTERYFARQNASVPFATFGVYDRQIVCDIGPTSIDYFRSACAARYAARLLNSGLASVNPHATVGCKVVAR